MIPLALLCDPLLLPREKVLLCLLLSVGDKRPSTGSLAQDLDCTERTVRRMLKRLNRVGYVKVDLQPQKGGRGAEAWLRTIEVTMPYGREAGQEG